MTAKLRVPRPRFRRHKVPPWCARVTKTGKELARRTGLHYTTIYRIFRGEREPSISAARTIAKALGLTMDDLYRKLLAIKAQRVAEVAEAETHAPARGRRVRQPRKRR